MSRLLEKRCIVVTHSPADSPAAKKGIKQFVKNIDWKPVDDPLVLDLDGDGIEITSFSFGGVHFDIARGGRHGRRLLQVHRCWGGRRHCARRRPVGWSKGEAERLRTLLGLSSYLHDAQQ